MAIDLNVNLSNKLNMDEIQNTIHVVSILY